jgi:C_GCAxxG_C_C family probable redox protein
VNNRLLFSNEACDKWDLMHNKDVSDLTGKMKKQKAIQEARNKAEEMYRTGEFLCSEAILLVANEFLGKPMPNTIVKLASGFPVGMGMAGCVCGALSGGVMALGLRYGRTKPRAKTPGMFETSKELHDRFIARRGHTCCRVLIRHLQMGSPEHITQCTTITGEVAADVIDILSREDKEALCCHYTK